MDALLAEANATAADLCAGAAEDWKERAETCMDALVRKSIELRAVAIVLPDVWPFNRVR
jgi:hypothetical protein